MTVSYTHLDVYKRQASGCVYGKSPLPEEKHRSGMQAVPAYAFPVEAHTATGHFHFPEVFENILLRPDNTTHIPRPLPQYGQ